MLTPADVLDDDPVVPAKREPYRRAARVRARREAGQAPCTLEPRCRHAVVDHQRVVGGGAFCHVCLEVCPRPVDAGAAGLSLACPPPPDLGGSRLGTARRVRRACGSEATP